MGDASKKRLAAVCGAYGGLLAVIGRYRVAYQFGNVEYEVGKESWNCYFLCECCIRKICIMQYFYRRPAQAIVAFQAFPSVFMGFTCKQLAKLHSTAADLKKQVPSLPISGIRASTIQYEESNKTFRKCRHDGTICPG